MSCNILHHVAFPLAVGDEHTFSPCVFFFFLVPRGGFHTLELLHRRLKVRPFNTNISGVTPEILLSCQITRSSYLAVPVAFLTAASHPCTNVWHLSTIPSQSLFDGANQPKQVSFDFV